MPYIAPSRRVSIDSGESAPLGPGDLNYKFTSVICEYVEDNGKSYNTINEVVGALECAKLEFYRRLASPYEDLKIIQNGDVY